jgi:CRISPR system Cascade subunit CasC
MDQRRYVDIHILQTVPPANLNRDDQGNPKEAYFGGVRRARVSSQAWKRATRIAFAEQVPAEDLATRTKRIAAELTSRLESRTSLETEQAERIIAALLAPLGIKTGKRAGDTAYLLFVGRRQLDSIVGLVAERAGELAGLDDGKLNAAVKDLPVREKLQTGHPVDVALFGRMVADIPALNVDAAVQVAHALSTHAVELEFDYYTAVEDENEEDETGAGMIGTVGFNSATLYRYATIGLHQLQENLGETGPVLEAVDLFARSFARSIPSGHTNSFAHRTLPSLVAVVAREDQPVNLVSAFEHPVSANDGIAAESACRLACEYATSTRLWGDVPAYAGVCHAFEPGSEAGKEIAAAFGPCQTFPELLTGLHEHVAEFLGQAR